MKILFHENSKELWQFFIENQKNPCGCGSNMFHYEYDDSKIYGVCNACGEKIYTVAEPFVKEYLEMGKWIDLSNKKPSDYTILVDIDDTIEDLCGAWCKWLNDKHGTHVEHTDITEWDVSKFFPTLTKEQVFEPLHDENFWWTIEPISGASEYLKKLVDEGYNIYLCTSTDYRNVKPKHEAIIKRYFPFIDWRKVIIAYDKQMIKADFLIDDGIHNLEHGEYVKILMSATHNRSYNAEENDMHRVENWKEIYNLIHRLTD